MYIWEDMKDIQGENCKGYCVTRGCITVIVVLCDDFIWTQNINRIQVPIAEIFLYPTLLPYKFWLVHILRSCQICDL